MIQSNPATDPNTGNPEKIRQKGIILPKVNAPIQKYFLYLPFEIIINAFFESCVWLRTLNSANIIKRLINTELAKVILVETKKLSENSINKERIKNTEAPAIKLWISI